MRENLIDLEEVFGVGPTTATVLKQSQISSVEHLAMEQPGHLSSMTGLNETKSTKIIHNARVLLGIETIQTGFEVEVRDNLRSRLSTGNDKLDASLMGGIEAGSLVEFYGPARGGKTQWCHQLAAFTGLPISQGGREKKTIWLSTERSFKPLTLRMMAYRYNVDPHSLLSQVSVMEVNSGPGLIETLPTVLDLCTEDFGLIVIDSLMVPHWYEYIPTSLSKERLGQLSTLIHWLRKAAHATGITVVYTNHVYTQISSYGGNPNSPMGGHVLSHASDYRFYVSRRKDDERGIALMDHTALPECVHLLKIGWGGFYGDKQEKKETEEKITHLINSQSWGPSEMLRASKIKEKVLG